MRAEKTHKITLNHLLQKREPFCILGELKTAARTCLWICNDFSEEKPQVEKVCAKFLNDEEYKKFQDLFESACADNAKVIESRPKDKPEEKAEDKAAEKEDEPEEKAGKE